MKHLHLLSALAVVAFIFCSCSNTDYQRVIPADASAVVKIDVKSLTEKADFSHSSANEMLGSMLAAVVKGKDVKKMQSYINDPSSMGLDFSMPVYVFMVGQHLGVSIKVDDDGDLKKFIQMLQKQGMATKPIEKESLMCGSLLDDIQYTYSSNTFLLLTSLEGGNASTGRMARQLMKQDEEDSFSSSEAHLKMNEHQEDVVIYSQLNKNNMKALSGLENLLVWLPLSKQNVQMEALNTINFDEGKIYFSVKVWGKDEMSQKLIDDANKNLRSIQATYAHPSVNMVVWGAANLKGDWLLSHMKESKQAKEMLFLMERAVDIEQMLRAVDGDVAIELQNLGNNDIAYLAQVQLSNSDFLADVDYWKQSMKEYGLSMQSRGKDAYSMQMERDTYLWGVKEKKELFFASEKANMSPAPQSVLDNYMTDIKKSKFFIYVDLAALHNTMIFQIPWWGEKLRALKSIVVKSASADEMTMVVELTDKKDNFLKLLFK